MVVAWWVCSSLFVTRWHPCLYICPSPDVIKQDPCLGACDRSNGNRQRQTRRHLVSLAPDTSAMRDLHQQSGDETGGCAWMDMNCIASHTGVIFTVDTAFTIQLGLNSAKTRLQLVGKGLARLVSSKSWVSDACLEMQDKEYSCIVVGAGLSGLYAAQQLKKFFPDVLVVEAHSDIGGRVRQVREGVTYSAVSLESVDTVLLAVMNARAAAAAARHRRPALPRPPLPSPPPTQNTLPSLSHQLHGLAPWPIEAGPEFIHGAENHKLNQVCWPPFERTTAAIDCRQPASFDTNTPCTHMQTRMQTPARMQKTGPQGVQRGHEVHREALAGLVVLWRREEAAAGRRRRRRGGAGEIMTHDS